MNKFDKVCAVLSIPIGILFMILGAIGLFLGSNANFTLPPILGCLPFFLGWAMCVTLIKFWRADNRIKSSDIPSAKFLEFLSDYPEYRDASHEIQRDGFYEWLDRK